MAEQCRNKNQDKACKACSNC